MQLKQPFFKLPIEFDATSLAAEVMSLPAVAWVPHPTGFVGNEAVRLVTPNGEQSDGTEGPMGPTEWLARSSYIREVMGHLGGVWGRSRLMGLAAGREVPPHIDINYYWRTHLRIHIPIITNPDVLFSCDGETVHMKPGSCWIFDSFRPHDVQNKGPDKRIHLVLDTVGGGLIPELMRKAEVGNAETSFVGAGDGSDPILLFEKLNAPIVMSPWEMRCHVDFIRQFAEGGRTTDEAQRIIDEFVEAWMVAWTQYGTDLAGRANYTALVDKVRADLSRLGGDNLRLRNGLPLFRVLDQLVLQMALAGPELGDTASVNNQSQLRTLPSSEYRKRFEAPIFIVSTPRSGSTLLFETLERSSDVYSTGQESHWFIESVPGLAPSEKGWHSNQLNSFDATPERAEHLARSFYESLRDRDGRSALASVRMLEKTPKNALRVPFLNAIWPDAQFLYLYRDVRQTLYSMMEAWHSGGFRTYPQLPGWNGPAWSLLLVPGWQRLQGLQLPQIVAHQWAITTEQLIDDLERLPAERLIAVDYDELIAAPQETIELISKHLRLDWDQQLPDLLPLSKTTVSKPQAEKWRRAETMINALWPIVEQADKRARTFLQKHRVSELSRGVAPSLGLERSAR